MANAGNEFKTFYENSMRDDSKYKVTISGLYGGSVSGVLNAPMPIAGSNEFESAKSALGNLPIAGKVFQAGQAVSDAIRITGNDTTLSIEQTRKIWQESRVPALSIEVTFWGLEAGVNRPIDQVRRIYSGLFPTKRDDFLVQAPLGYKFIDGSSGGAQGTLNLSIGKWFRATGLVMTNANFTPSLEVMADGSPLYMTGTVDLEPYRMITYGEYLAWFRKTQAPKKFNESVAPKEDASDLDNFVANVKNKADELLGKIKKLV